MNENENLDDKNDRPSVPSVEDFSEEEETAEDNASPAAETPGAPERLQKLIARAGLASRRAAEEMIAAGQVSVNGHVIRELGAKADPQRDRIVVDGKPLYLSDKAFTVVLLHKPRGCVTTKSDPEKRPTVFDLLPKKFRTLHPVGRLDFDTAGVLLLTDDGELTHLLTHPSHGIEKVYHARARGEIKPEILKKVAAGVWISGDSGEVRDVKTLPCRVKLKAQTENNALLEIALREGRNRQIRKMMEAVGHPVSALRRISFAGIELEGLPSGAHRVLLPGEVHELKKRAARSVEKARKDRNKPPDPEKPDARAKPSTDKPRSARPVSRGPASKGPASKGKPTGHKPSGHKSTGHKPTGRKPAAGQAKSRNASTPIGERIRREWK